MSVHKNTWKGQRTVYHKIRDYARCINRPWNWRNAAADLGVPKRQVMSAMASLRAEGEIVRIGDPKQGMHLHSSRMPSRCKIEYDWTPDRVRLEAILKNWEPGTFRDAAACARACGLAVRTTYRYLETLVHVGAVEWCRSATICGSFRRTELDLPETLPPYSEVQGALQRRADAT